MIAVIFEVTPTATGKTDYFQLAQSLKSALEQIDGFISIERFQSLTDPNKFLSLSFWQTEQAIKTWREFEAHQTAQQLGKTQLFESYRIRVGHIERDYGCR